MNDVSILMVDDDPRLIKLLARQAGRWGYHVEVAPDARAALEFMERESFHLVISDQNMPRMTGIDLLRAVRKRWSRVGFIILTGYGNVNDAVTALKLGADDYLLKPCDAPALQAAIIRAIRSRELREENRRLKGYLECTRGFEAIIHRSPAMKTALRLARKVAASPQTSVALYGESGTAADQSQHFLPAQLRLISRRTRSPLP